MSSRFVACALAASLVGVASGPVGAQTPPAEAQLQPVLRALSAGGGRTVQDLESVRDDTVAALRGCRALAVRAGVAADTPLRVSVDATGRVTSATVLAEGSVSAVVGRWHRCATRAVSGLRLPVGAAGTLEFSVRWASADAPSGALGSLLGDQIGSEFGFGAGPGPRRRGGPISSVRGGAPDVTGSLSPEVIQRVVRRHINEVRFCYERALAATPALAGRLEVMFVIAPTGAIAVASTASDTLGSPDVTACILGAVRRWTFPAPEGGGVVQVRYPFVFSAAAPPPPPSE